MTGKELRDKLALTLPDVGLKLVDYALSQLKFRTIVSVLNDVDVEGARMLNEYLLVAGHKKKN